MKLSQYINEEDQHCCTKHNTIINSVSSTLMRVRRKNPCEHTEEQDIQLPYFINEIPRRLMRQHDQIKGNRWSIGYMYIKTNSILNTLVLCVL